MKVGLRLRTIAVSSLAALALIGACLGGGSSPSPVASPQVQQAAYSLTPKVTYRWWGVTVVFNKDATRLIAAGGIPAYAAIIGLIGGPALAVIAGAGAAGLAGEIASQAVEHGNCFEQVVMYTGQTWMWRAHC